MSTFSNGPDHPSINATADKDASILSLDDLLLQADYFQILNSPLARIILGHEKHPALPLLSLEQPENAWVDFFGRLLDHPSAIFGSAKVIRPNLVVIGVAALHAFLQSNVTGPPLPWPVSSTLFPRRICDDSESLKSLRRKILTSVTVDGEAIYSLTPHVELFILAKRILTQEQLVLDHGPYRWERLRVNFWHQRMLNDVSTSLQQSIYDDLEAVGQSSPHQQAEIRATYFLEKAAIDMYFGFDIKAREDLVAAARETGFEFTLTGRLGKRTKFQQDEISQLVVLARSAPRKADEKRSPPYAALDDRFTPEAQQGDTTSTAKPLNLNLNDDTLLEAISFSKEPKLSTQDDVDIPESLSVLDPANQPLLQPLDSIILLATASSITNNSPQDGLTREETLPYATRVLQDKGTNWQIYSQALLVRSRIEGYRSRTVERGVLQLQAVVDQVIAETTPVESSAQVSDAAQEGTAPVTTFLPKPKTSESAPASERLLHIHQLASPTRWKLEAELADRWVSLGGLRTALEIYERLEMWAEVALCWAASDREDEARKIIRRQLYEDAEQDGVITQERASLPLDAPRLFCILGDLEKSPSAYQRAWDVSKHRYARAQRSLGKYYLAKSDFPRAEEAYVKSLKISPQNHSTWFVLGSVRLRSERWEGAVEAFGRAIQLDETDAESWSNLAAALLNLGPNISSGGSADTQHQEPVRDSDAEIDDSTKSAPDPEKHVREAFVALKRAAVLKRDSYRIWQNLLLVAAKLSPPPLIDIVIAQSRLIDLRGKTEGERCVDVEVVEDLLAHLISTTSSSSSTSKSVAPSSPPTPASLRNPATQGFPKLLTDLIQKKITPLITTSRRLWLLTAKLLLYQNRPAAALATYEKAWRATLNQPGWESGFGAGSVVTRTGITRASSDASTSNEAKAAKILWTEVVDATIDLVDAYESLGEREHERGREVEVEVGVGGGMDRIDGGSEEMGRVGESEVKGALVLVLVCKQWNFKARSALRAVLARAKDGWGSQSQSEFELDVAGKHENEEKEKERDRDGDGGGRGSYTMLERRLRGLRNR